MAACVWSCDCDESEDDKAEKDNEKSRLAKFRVTMAGFTSHMESREGGSKTSEHSKLAAKRLWILLEGTYLRCRHTQLQPSAVAVFAWIVSLIETEFAHISKFLDELALRKGLKANTIKAYLTSAYIPFLILQQYIIFISSSPTNSNSTFLSPDSSAL